VGVSGSLEKLIGPQKLPLQVFLLL